MDWWDICLSLFCCQRSVQTDSNNMSVKSDSPVPGDRKNYNRRSYGYIRPPNIQRDNQAPVTLKGWAFRLEGGPLRQWRKRWFVLSDYCLFFYKDSEEDKLVGSVILPSYRISPCSADDRITRKYAFKAEHHNMKTYYFAVESRELMIQWMNALCLATIMQTFTRRHCSTDQLSMLPTPGVDEEDSGFVSYQSRKLQDPDDLRETLNGSFASAQSTNDLPRDIDGNFVVNDGTSDSGFISSSERHLSHYGSQSLTPCTVYARGKAGQHYYAVGPPKPKRLHASYTSLPHCAPDLVPSNDMNPGRGMFIPPPDHRSFYGSYMKDPSFRSSDNWKNDYSYWTLENDRYHQPQMQHYLQMSIPVNSESRSRQMTDQDHENSVFYRDSVQPINNMSQGPPLARRHSDMFGRGVVEFEQSSVPPISGNINQSGIEKMDLTTRETQEPSYFNDRTLGSTTGKNYYRTTHEYNYLVSSSPKHQESNCHGVVSAHPVFIDENMYVPFDGRHWESEVLAPYFGLSNSDEWGSRSKAHQKESMKKLIEWKERMLMCPVSKKQNFGENRTLDSATFNGSSGIPPPRPPLPEEYCQQVLQNLETQEMQKKMQELQLQNNEICKTVHPGPFVEIGQTVHPVPFVAPKHDGNLLPSEIVPKPRRLSCGEVEREIRHHAKTNIGGRWDEKSQRSNRSSSRSHEHHRSTSALNTVANNYSSDDEESPSSSGHMRENYKPKTRKVSLRGKNRRIVGRTVMSDSELHVHQSSKVYRLLQHSTNLTSKHKNISISAGELLGKTHEELVLFLVQLRQSQRRLFKARERCQLHISNEQHLIQMKPTEKEHKVNYVKLSEQVEELQNQYVHTCPLVNLVENLVKLETLTGDTEKKSNYLSRLEKVGIEKYVPSEKMLEFAHHLQERQRLRNEIQGVEMVASEDEGLEDVLSHLYQLDCMVQEEFSNFGSLQKDKEMLEQSLKTVKRKLGELYIVGENPVGIENLRKQQRLIQKELSHVANMLSQSAVRLEERTVEVCKVKTKVAVYRQKLQHALGASHRRKEMSSISKADLESELLKIQNFLESLAKHHQEINNLIETLKLKSKQKRFPFIQKVRDGAQGIVGCATLPPKRKYHRVSMETELDQQRKTESHVETSSQLKRDTAIVSSSGIIENGTVLDNDHPTDRNIVIQLNEEHPKKLNCLDQQPRSIHSIQCFGQEENNQEGRLKYTNKYVDQTRISQREQTGLLHLNQYSSQSLYLREDQTECFKQDSKTQSSKLYQQPTDATFKLEDIHLTSSQDTGLSQQDKVIKPNELDTCDKHITQKKSDQQLSQACLTETDHKMNVSYSEEVIKLKESEQAVRMNQLDTPARPNHPDKCEKLHQLNQHTLLHQANQHEKQDNPNQDTRLNEQDQHIHSNYSNTDVEPDQRLNQQDHYGKPNSILNQPNKHGILIQPDHNSRIDKDDKHIQLDQSTRLDQTNNLTNHYHLEENQPHDINVVGLPLKDASSEKQETRRNVTSADTKKVSYGSEAEVWVIDDINEGEIPVPHRPTSLFSPIHTVQTHRKTLSAHERLFGGASTSPLSTSSTERKSTNSRPQMSPRHYVQAHRKPKRRHHTITGTGSQPLVDESSPRMFGHSSRHCHMDRYSRTASTPDIVRSTIRKSEIFDEKLIDRELGLPQKIDIPERYIEDEPEMLSVAEKLKRDLKAENIRKMLSESTTFEKSSLSETMKKKMDEEKKRRAHLLALNHTIAKEVMEKSKVVATHSFRQEQPKFL